MWTIMNIGDIVTRTSYHHDIAFVIEEISASTVTLSGLHHRLLADTTIWDLLPYKQGILHTDLTASTTEVFVCSNLPNILSHVFGHASLPLPLASEKETRDCQTRILHIDGNKRYLKECLAQYMQYAIPVIGVSIRESEQPKKIQSLLELYRPNIVVITGHDSTKRLATFSQNMDCYVNSKYFAEAVQIARAYNPDYDELVIIAGGCKSNYEALMDAGANYASSPSRILINVTEPVLIACKLASTPYTQMIDIATIQTELPSGKDGFGGITTRGQCRQHSHA